MKSDPRTRILVALVALLVVYACGGGGGGGAGTGTSTPAATSPPSTTSPGTPAAPGAGSSPLDLITFHNDYSRSGLNADEKILTQAAVSSGKFGRLNFLATDGLVDAQLLYLYQLDMGAQGVHNVLFTVTEHDSAYAFDADSGALLWKTSALKSGETPSDKRGCTQVVPEIGITATPVIDRSQGAHGLIYFVAMSVDSSGNYYQRLHALDVTTGAEALGGPVTVAASYPGTGDNSSNGRVVFDAKQYKERAALLALNGTVYIAFSSHCDDRPYTGWLMGYSETSLHQTAVLDITPNGSEGAIWMSGGGPAADSSGNIYLLAANGSFDTNLNAKGFPAQGDFGNAFLKISTQSGLSVSDYFAMHDDVTESNADQDLGSGGSMLLPDMKDSSGTTLHLAIGAGKAAGSSKNIAIYVVNRDNMGKFNPASNAGAYQVVSTGLGGQQGIYGVPAYFNNTVYFGAVNDQLRGFTFANAQLPSTSSTQTNATFQYPGVLPSVSANGVSDAIVWVVESSSPAVLHAYNANDLSQELYNSNTAANNRDQFGSGNKFMTPSITNGKVFVGTPSGVAVFGLMP